MFIIVDKLRCEYFILGEEPRSCNLLLSTLFVSTRYTSKTYISELYLDVDHNGLRLLLGVADGYRGNDVSEKAKTKAIEKATKHNIRREHQTPTPQSYTQYSFLSSYPPHR